MKGLFRIGLFSLAALAIHGGAAQAQVTCNSDKTECSAKMPRINQLASAFSEWDIDSSKEKVNTNICAPTSSTMALLAFTDAGLKAKNDTELKKMAEKTRTDAVKHMASLMNTSKTGGTSKVNLIDKHTARAWDFDAKMTQGNRYVSKDTYVNASLFKSRLKANAIPVFSVGHFEKKCEKDRTNKDKSRCTFSRNGGHTMTVYKFVDGDNPTLHINDPWGAALYSRTLKSFKETKNTTLVFPDNMSLATAKIFKETVAGKKYDLMEGTVWVGKK